jgi:hypothetical protein
VGHPAVGAGIEPKNRAHLRTSVGGLKTTFFACFYLGASSDFRIREGYEA